MVVGPAVSYGGPVIGRRNPIAARIRELETPHALADDGGILDLRGALQATRGWA